MAAIEVSNPIEGALGMRYAPAAPTGGTDEVQTLTLANATGGSFTLTYSGLTTAPIPWNATNATLLAAIDSALEALPNIGTGNIAATAGTLTAGLGTVLLTFGGTLAQDPHPLIVADGTPLTGGNATAVVTRTTAGVAPRGRGCPRGAQLVDTATGTVYVNTSGSQIPTWTKVGSQT